MRMTRLIKSRLRCVKIYLQGEYMRVLCQEEIEEEMDYYVVKRRRIIYEEEI